MVHGKTLRHITSQFAARCARGFGILFGAAEFMLLALHGADNGTVQIKWIRYGETNGDGHKMNSDTSVTRLVYE